MISAICWWLAVQADAGLPFKSLSRDLTGTIIGKAVLSRTYVRFANDNIRISQNDSLLILGGDAHDLYSILRGKLLESRQMFRFTVKNGNVSDTVAYDESQQPQVVKANEISKASNVFDPYYFDSRRAFAFSGSGRDLNGNAYGLFAIMRLEERGTKPNAVGNIKSEGANSQNCQVLFHGPRMVNISWCKGRWAKTNLEARTVTQYRFTDTGSPKLKIEKLPGFTVPNPSPKDLVTRIWVHDVARRMAIFQTKQGYYIFQKGHKSKRLPERTGSLLGSGLLLLRGRVVASNLERGSLAFLDTAKMEWIMVDGLNYLLAVSPDEDQLLLVTGPEKRVMLVDLK